MATLVLTAAGTAIGGPIGATIGSFIGSQIDARLFGPPDREGPRLQELKVTTSSYGTPMPRHFGTMRAAGTIIWATDLKEASEETGGKGQPKVTTFSYSASFAVAIASRPISHVGRIWADGNLLRGEAGDLKTAGELRVYQGLGDQLPDPLIASAEGAASPAFRGLAYCVFEELQLAEFGNRIPSLTFEVIADDGSVRLTELLQPFASAITADRSLEALEGYSDEGGAMVETLAAIHRVYPLASRAEDEALTLSAADSPPGIIPSLPTAVVDQSGDGFGKGAGRVQNLGADESRIPAGLRYFDIDRDYQAGLQRAGGRAMPGRNRLIEFPGAMRATSARKLANDAADRARWAQERLSYRIAEIDPKLAPGQWVTVPGKSGNWQIEAWEWRENGVDLELLRLPHRKTAAVSTDSGRALPQQDLQASPTMLEAFELPWDGSGPNDEPQIMAAVSSSTSGWRGAALYAQTGGALTPLGGSGSRRSTIGALEAAIDPSACVLMDRRTHLTIALASTDLVLESCTLMDLAEGRNRALLGDEVIQFAEATDLGAGRWRLSSLLRGRGGTEGAAHTGHAPGTTFVLLDDRPIRLDSTQLGLATSIAAIGLGDSAPVVGPVSNRDLTLRPLTPVHGRADRKPEGQIALCWTRRARGAWTWSSTVDVPLVEQAELYEVGVGNPLSPSIIWETSSPSLVIDDEAAADLLSNFAGAAIWVRQIGTHDRSNPLHLTTIG